MAEGAAAQPAGGGGARRQIVEWLVTALPAVAGSISFVGFVAVLGAAITWARFGAAQLPADQAVSKIPKSDLVGIGAVSLVAFLFLGLIAVLIVYLLQRRPYRKIADAVRDLEDDLTVARRRAAAIDRDLTAAGGDGEGAPAGRALATEREVAYREVAKLHARLIALEAQAYGESYPPPTLANQAGILVIVAAEVIVAIFEADAKGGVKFLLAGAVAGATAAAIYIPFATAEKGERPDSVLQSGSDAKSQFFLSLSQAAAILGPFILIGALVDVLVVEAGAVAVLLGVATLAIGRVQPRRFFWYGFAIFASVALYGAAFEGLRTINDPSVQPVGVVLKDGRGVPGLYVTETKDRLYLARVGHKEKAPTEPLHSDGRLFWVPRSEVQVYSVGPLQHIDRANDRAPQLVQELQDGISPGVSGGP